MTYEYKPDDKFGYKDTLPEGHDEKIIKGSEFDDEFKKISNAFKVLDPDFDGDIEIGGIDGLQDALDGKADQSALEKEIQDRKDGDQALQDQIDKLDPDGDFDIDWSDVENKPSEFPPSAHQHGWDEVTGKPADYPPSSHSHAWGDITGKPSEFPPADHNHDGDYIKTETDPTVPDHVKGITTDDIDNWNAGGGGASTWDELTGKPTEFPPEAHTQGWDTITGKPADFPPSAHDHAWSEITGKPTEFPPEAHNQDWSTIENTPSEYPPEAHTHGQDEVDGLELRLEAIEGSITDGGGFVDAPDDGKLYGRQSEAWAEVVIPDGGASSWNDLTDKPADFPPSDHTHDIDDVNGLQDALDAAGAAPAWDDVTGKPTEFPPEAHQHGWDQITGKPSDYPPSSHNHDGVYQPVGDYIGEAPNDNEEYARKNKGWVKLQDHNYTGADAVKLTGDQSVAGHKTWTGVATFGDTVTMRGTLNGDDTANFQNAVTAGSFVKTGGTSAEYLMADGSVSSGPTGGTGSSVHIGEAPPDDPVEEGQQWMEVPTSGDATMWIYDGDKWLQQPGGKDGAAGADGNIADATEQGVIATWDDTAGQWTPEGNLSFDANGRMYLGEEKINSHFYSNGAMISRRDVGNHFQAEFSDGTEGFDGRNLIGAMNSDTGEYTVLIGTNGDATFSGQVNIKGQVHVGDSGEKQLLYKGGDGQLSFRTRTDDGATTAYVTFERETSGANATVVRVSSNRMLLGSGSSWATTGMTLDSNGNLTVQGSINKDGSTPLISTRDLIETLSTLRNATKDENTLEGLRDAIGNAVGGLIEKFEAMQSTATQEIEV